MTYSTQFVLYLSYIGHVWQGVDELFLKHPLVKACFSNDLLQGVFK